MLDLKWIRQYPQDLDANLKRRNHKTVSHEILELDHLRRNLQTQIQDLQNERHVLAESIGEAKKTGQDAIDLIAKAAHLKEILPKMQKQEQDISNQLYDILNHLPNLLDDQVPEGTDESANQEIRQWKERPVSHFSPLSHYDLGKKLGLMDFEQAAKISGSRFVILKGALARLERALGQFMIDLHCENFGYQEISAPLLVREESLFGTGQLPKFAQDLFRTTENHWLISTSEVSLTNLVRETILDENQLPLRYTTLSPCFRSEAGAAGRDTRGMIRQHQFYKVELVSIVHPDQNEDEHQRMLEIAETVLKKLELPYRVMLLCAGDTGSTAKRTYDLEVWLPSEQSYREISSCSQCGDYQARRMQARFRRSSQENKQKSNLDYVYTLNGSGVAVGRALIAIMENYQNEDGSITIPDVLIPYMKGLKRITSHD